MALNGASAAQTVEVGSGVLQLGAAHRLASTARVNVAGQLALGGDEAIQRLGGNGTVQLRSGAFSVAEGSFAGNLAGTGSLIKTGAGTLTLMGNSSYDGVALVQAGTLAVQGSLCGSGGIQVGNGGTLGGAGLVCNSVSVQDGGRLSPGNSPGMLTVQGNVTLQAQSLFDVDIDGHYNAAGGAGSHDRIVLDGVGTRFQAGGVIRPVMRGISGSARNDFVARAGDVFTVVEAPQGSVSGAFSGIAQPTSGGLAANSRFDVLYLPTQVQLAVTPDNLALAVAQAGARRNAVAVAAAADGVRPSAVSNTGTAQEAFFKGLAGKTEAQVATLFSGMTGEAHATSLAHANFQSWALRDAIFNRRPVKDCKDDSSTQSADCRGFWVDFSRSQQRFKADDWAGASTMSGNLSAAGVEQSFRNLGTLGIALGVHQGGVSGDVASSSLLGVQLSGYGTLATRWGSFTQVLGLGSTKHEIGRSTDLYQTPALRNSTEYRSWRIYSDSRLATPLLSQGTFSLASITGLRLDYLRRGQVSEAGSVPTALTMARYSKLDAQADLGVEIRHTYLRNDSRTGYGVIDALYSRKLSGHSSVNTAASMYGASWDVRSADQGANFLTLGIGLTDQGKTHSFSVRATARFSETGFQGNGVQVSSTLKW